MGHDRNLGLEANPSGLWNKFMNLLIPNPHHFDKCIKSIIFCKCNHLHQHCSNVGLTIMLQKDRHPDGAYKECQPQKEKLNGLSKLNYPFSAKSVTWSGNYFQFEKYLAKLKIHTEKILRLTLDTAVTELNSGTEEVCTYTHRYLHFIKSLTCHTCYTNSCFFISHLCIFLTAGVTRQSNWPNLGHSSEHLSKLI